MELLLPRMLQCLLILLLLPLEMPLLLPRLKLIWKLLPPLPLQLLLRLLKLQLQHKLKLMLRLPRLLMPELKLLPLLLLRQELDSQKKLRKMKMMIVETTSISTLNSR